MQRVSQDTCGEDGVAGAPVDLVKRFTRTPMETSFPLFRTRVHLSTNSPALQKRFSFAVAPCQQQAEFHCKIVVEPVEDEDLARGCPTVSRIHANGLSLISIGQKSFLALDAVNRRAVSFVSELLILDEALFRGYFLPALTLLLQCSSEITP